MPQNEGAIPGFKRERERENSSLADLRYKNKLKGVLQANIKRQQAVT